MSTALDLTADLRGADLRGADLEYLSLVARDLQGADLRNATLRHVALDGADLRGARLDQASVRNCSAVGAAFTGVSAVETAWFQVDLTGAVLDRMALDRALLHRCELEGASLANARLAGATIGRSGLDRGDLRGAQLHDATTVGTSFEGAHFEGATEFATCREIVVEILAPLAVGDRDRSFLLAALARERGWCYEEWVPLLEQRPGLLQAVLERFESYPGCGVPEAIRAVHQQLK